MTTPAKPHPTTILLVAADVDLDAAWTGYRAALIRGKATELALARARLHDAVDAKADRGRPGFMTLADGLVLVETRHFEIRAVIAVPVEDIGIDGPVPSQTKSPDAHLGIFRPVVAASD